MPLLGIHFEQRLRQSLSLELFICGGPLYGSCTYGLDYTIESRSDDKPAETSHYWLEERGSDEGIALEGGGRLSYSIGRGFQLFVEAGYAYQVVGRMYGPGSNDTDGIVEEWEGEWGMKEYYKADYWGAIDLIHASNHWEYPQKNLWVRRFKLDLSGVQLRMGISYRF